MFENLPVKLTQQEERMLRAIVAPESAKGRIRRTAIELPVLLTVLAVVIFGAAWGLSSIVTSDLSKYESLADAAFKVLAMGVIVGNCYFLVVKPTKLRKQLILKFYAALSSTDASKADTNPTDD